MEHFGWPPGLIAALQAREAAMQVQPQRCFELGDRVRLVDGAFAGVEGIFQLAEGEHRVMVLIELLSRPVLVPVDPGNLRRLG